MGPQKFYRGWRGVTDPSHVLLAVQYEPVSGTLACRFASTEEPYAYLEVPENIYDILCRTPYAMAYLRKHVVGRYTCLNEKPPAFKPKEKPSPKKIAKTEPRPSATMSLFLNLG